LLSLCLLGGGIATTAGGVKLLRAYALYKHGVREMRRLIHPSSVGGSGITARRIRKEGALIAWIFLMLFLLGISLCLLLLTALGQGFDDALALSVAALTNTGPAATLLDADVSYAALSTAEQLVLGIGMVFGRLEALVFVSLLNPAAWRR
ncbi:MAG: potassium transporter TrkG, partial [Pseudomonadota bacterium]